MTYRGRVENGQILLDEPRRLPEGARVNIEVVEREHDVETRQHSRVRSFQPIEMPGDSLAEQIIRERR